MNFNDAMQHVLTGSPIRRPGWAEGDDRRDIGCNLDTGGFYVDHWKASRGIHVYGRYFLTRDDLLATDWEAVPSSDGCRVKGCSCHG